MTKSNQDFIYQDHEQHNEEHSFDDFDFISNYKRTRANQDIPKMNSKNEIKNQNKCREKINLAIDN